MAKDKFSIKSTVVSTVMGMSLLLFLLGLLGFSLIGWNEVEKSIKQNVQVDIFFRDDAREVDILKMEKEVSSLPYIRVAKYVSKDSALALMMQNLGEESFDILDGANPYRASIAVYLNSSHIHLDSVENFKQNILKGNELVIESVDYNKKQFSEISSTFKNLKFPMLIIAFVLLFISIALIYNTIRLAVFSKRFTIKTMQLVGAKSGFIRKPFLLSAVGQGFVSAIVAIILLIVFGYFLQQIFPSTIPSITSSEAVFQKELLLFATVFGGIILGGMAISLFSTFFALNKYIWIKTDKLY